MGPPIRAPLPAAGISAATCLPIRMDALLVCFNIVYRTRSGGAVEAPDQVAENSPCVLYSIL